jgi:2-polyprenyl-6-methoxyphenol hydroxylase-like FAD-dependent oxidoreductase
MTMQAINDTYDAVIVGARCAGAATAMLLASFGLRVLLFDKSGYGTDTLSTHALMRPAVLLLHRWGLTDRLEAEGTPRITRTSFLYADNERREQVEVDIKPRHGVDTLYAPRRSVLDRILVDAAREAGADVHHGVQMLDLLHADGRVAGVRLRDESGRARDVRAGIVIGADGRRSGVARLAGSTPYMLGRHMTSSAYGYFSDLPIDGNRWYYRPGMGAGAIPTNDGHTLLFASTTPDFAQRSAAERARAFHRVIREAAPDIGARVSDAQLVGKLYFFGGMRGFVRQPWGDGWALVGDAGYMTDPITAHGITNALRDAELLARAIIEGGRFTEYQAARDDLSLEFFEVSDRVASLDWDIPTVQQYHRMMSKEMGREEEALMAMGEASATAA